MRAIITASLFLVLATPARADEKKASVKIHVDEAMRLFKAHDPRGAIVELQMAYDISPDPQILFNIGSIYRSLASAGETTDARRAIVYFERFLATNPKEKDRRETEGYLSELQKRFPVDDHPAADAPVKAESGRAVGSLDTSSVNAPSSAPLLVEKPAALRISGGEQSATEQSRPRRKLRSWEIALIATGAVVLTGAAIGLGVGLTQGNDIPSSTLGAKGGPFQ